MVKSIGQMVLKGVNWYTMVIKITSNGLEMTQLGTQ